MAEVTHLRQSRAPAAGIPQVYGVLRLQSGHHVWCALLLRLHLTSTTINFVAGRCQGH